MSVDASGRLNILLVEDNPGDARLVEHALRNETGVFETPEVTHVETLDAAADELDCDRHDLVLLDLGLPKSSGLETLDRLQERITDSDRSVPVVVLTGLDDHETALDAIEAGAQDYLVKGDIDGTALERAIRYALERHQQEQELKRQNERLERFASVVSHDLRNPLNAARGTVRALAEDADDDEQEHFDRVLRAHERMEDIVEDVLTLARQGQAVDETRPVDLRSLVDDCRETVDSERLAVEVRTERAIEADPGRLSQIVENLLRNAVEHTDGDVTVTVGDLADGFFVADDGPGIPAEDREDVFEAGFTTNDEGTGFGLNIVKDIAEAHGWQVTLTESADGGARFEFTGVEFAGDDRESGDS